jgi:hypothetical protein
MPLYLQTNNPIIASMWQWKKLRPQRTNNFTADNPSVFRPVIRFRNVGSEPLKEVEIKYGTKGFKNKSYKWTGHLEFYEETTLVLPGPVEFNEGENVFEVELVKPNEKKDQWTADNSMSSTFKSLKTLPLDFVVAYKANKKPEENRLFIINEKQDTVYQRNPQQCKPTMLYTEGGQVIESN